jgi:hypothetical protein
VKRALFVVCFDLGIGDRIAGREFTGPHLLFWLEVINHFIFAVVFVGKGPSGRFS